ncbi:hypothetical protein ACFSTD_18715 [Novosphingobium colocasiae]|uniref:Uncharacterized protein n=1 Tax=Novosphingobium colocasiae TaxID=1256513 RepID=A0A918P934_9SPHN|nr:hypothetical protein [Novosphingobium colocasiae]GGY91456.1 hypothetical protein GCM10011614_02680 [Novosphingobium colocasiae]
MSATTVSWRWCLALVLLCAVPLLYPHTPPLTDLPAHMARFMVQLDAGRSPDIARWYSFHWNLIPNLGTDLLAQALVPLIGLEPTMKAIALLIVILQVSGYLRVAKAAHGLPGGAVPITALLALPLAYGNPFQYGFLNFTFTVGLAFHALAFWMDPRLAARPRLRWAIFVPVGCAIWVSHLAGWAVLCLMTGSVEWMARLDRTGRPIPALIRAGLACSCLLVPQVLRMVFPEGDPGHLPTEGLFHFDEKLFLLLNVLADRWQQLDIAFAAVLIGAILTLWVSPRYKLHKGLALAALVLFTAFLLLPRRVYGSFYTDMRMAPTMLALAVLAAGPRLDAVKRGLAVPAAAVIAFLAARLALIGVSMGLWDAQFRADLGVLDRIPYGTQAVTFTAMPCRTFVLQGRERRTHLASFALVRRHAFANDQFEMPGGQLITIHNPAAEPFRVDPSTLEIGEECYGAIPVLDSVAKVPRATRTMWIIWDVPELPVRGWRVVARSGDSVLYRR